MTRILATGDVHLGQGSGYGRLPGDRLRDQDAVLGQIADLAIERVIDVVIVAGDVFDGPTITPEQLDVYARFIARCHAAEIPVVSVLGNSKHDAALRETNGLDIFKHVPGIHVSSRPEIVDVAGITIATLPWTHPGRLVAAQGGGDRDDVNCEAAGLLVAAARGLRASIPDGRPAVLALHWSVSGSALPNGLPVDDLREPVLDWDALADLGFDLVVAGHIHKRQLLGGEDSGTVGFYVGSPLPLNFGESADEHGVWIVELSDEVFDGIEYEFVPIYSPSFTTIDVDITGDTETSGLAYVDIGHAWNAQDGAIVRVRIRATADQWRRVDVAAITHDLKASGAAVVKVEPDIVREDRARVDGVHAELAPLEAYDLWASASDLDPALASRARVRLAEHLEAVAA